MDGPTPALHDSIDEQLLAQVSKGDLQAFGRLYDASSTVLYTLAMRILGQRDDASETLRDVYLELWRKAARYDRSRGTPMVWLITLTRNRALERMRARSHRPRTRRRGGEHASVDPGAMPADAEPAEQVELRHIASQALAELPAEDRLLLEWGYFDGMSCSEMAMRLNEPGDTIKARLHQGMTRLRHRLRATSNPRYGT